MLLIIVFQQPVLLKIVRKMMQILRKKIKKSLRSTAIYSPAQYFTLIRTGKSNGKPFTVNELTYDSFYDFKEVSPKIGKTFPKIFEINL